MTRGPRTVTGTGDPWKDSKLGTLDPWENWDTVKGFLTSPTSVEINFEKRGKEILEV